MNQGREKKKVFSRLDGAAFSPAVGSDNLARLGKIGKDLTVALKCERREEGRRGFSQKEERV